MKPSRIRITGLSACLMLAMVQMLSARVNILTLVEKTRIATLIVTGQIVELRTESVLIRTDKAIKGMPTTAVIEVAWDRKGNIEMPAAVHAVGEQLVLFADLKGTRYEPLEGPQGTVKLAGVPVDQYEFAIRKILEFDSGNSAQAKAGTLVSMLDANNRMTQVSALEIVYLESPTNTFAVAPLVQPVVRLTQSRDTQVAVKAIQAFSRVGDKASVPVIIKLLGSSETPVAETAFQVLKGMTRADLAFDPKQPNAQRTAAARRWQEWWDKNQDSVILVR